MIKAYFKRRLLPPEFLYRAVTCAKTACHDNQNNSELFAVICNIVKPTVTLQLST